MTDLYREQADILVVGGGNVESTSRGYATKDAIAQYLIDLSDEFRHVTWIAQSSGTWGTQLERDADELTGLLPPNRIRVIPAQIGIRNLLGYWRLFWREAAQHQFGVFFLPASMLLAPVMGIACRNLRATASYVGGDYFEGTQEISRGRFPGYGLLLRQSHLAVFRATDLVIARGHKLARIASAHNERVVRTVPLANLKLHTDNSTIPTSTKRGRLLFIGIVAESKGIRQLLQSVRQIAVNEARGEVTLSIVGDGPDLERFQLLSDELGISDRVEFAGWIDDGEELERHFRLADILVMPSSTHPEGVPRVIDEAILRRIPVVATTVGGVAEEFPDGGVLLAQPGSVESLSNLIATILDDPDQRSSLVKAQSERRDWLVNSGSAGRQHARELKRIAEN